MKLIIQILPLLLLWPLACSNGIDKESATATNLPPDGKSIYKINCVQCHGLYGNMGASGSFDLTVSELSLEERIEVITNGRNTMLPFKGSLSPEKIEAVAAYTLQLKVSEE